MGKVFKVETNMQLFILDFISFRSILLSFEIVSKISILFIKRRKELITSQMKEKFVGRTCYFIHIMNDLYLFVFSISLCLQVNMPADSFESPLTLAACGGHVELAMLLLERGANIEEVNDEGYTPLMEASREGHEEMVALLLSQVWCPGTLDYE